MRPTDDEFKAALAEIERMRLEGEADPYHIIKCFHYLQQRDVVLEGALARAERYLRFGQPVEDHACLRRLLDEIIEERRRETEEEGEHFGL